MILIPPHIVKSKDGSLSRLIRLNPDSYVMTSFKKENMRLSCPVFQHAELMYDGLDHSYSEFLHQAAKMIEVSPDVKVNFLRSDPGYVGIVVNGKEERSQNSGDQYLEELIKHLCQIHHKEFALLDKTVPSDEAIVLKAKPDDAGHEGYLPQEQFHIFFPKGKENYAVPEMEQKPFSWLYFGVPSVWTPHEIKTMIRLFQNMPWGISGTLDWTWHHDVIKEAVEHKMIAARLEFQPEKIDTYILMASLGVRVCVECYFGGPTEPTKFFLQEIGIRFRP